MASSSDETSLATTGEKRSGASRGWLAAGQLTDAGAIPIGTVLEDRYRIIGMLGRGGMGEVYRADDLRLGQPVALKFLPEAVAGDAVRLAQFHTEVRVARQVSHRNVCRVYDIGESAGRVFLTMEYVDGEDLATLLRRIGRLPQDKGVEIARQICAGLAAAHDQGVLHRDLKPANVMIDGEGRARITDFGLAGLAGEIKDVQSGTPAYMAPEQLAGREVSVRSDIFALGLVLFEIFTGRRAFDAKTVAELLRQHDRGLQGSMSSSVRDLDPAIERVIERCLAPQPTARPASALAVSAALPGGDPLAAALAAGETPSREMVAAAGRSEAVPLPQALGLALTVCLLLAVTIVSRSAQSFTSKIPFDKPPAVLKDRATEVLSRLGYREPPADTVSDFMSAFDYPAWVVRTQSSPDRWKYLPSGRVPVAGYWVRTSPRPLVPFGSNPRPAISDPPFTRAGMTLLVLDTSGRVIEFHALPEERVAAPAQGSVQPAAPDWQGVFNLVGWSRERFVPATPEWTPRGFADARAAWTGTLPELGETPLRLEAAAYRGRVTTIRTLGPWSSTSEGRQASRDPIQRALASVLAVLTLGALGAAAVLARRNLKLHRGDRDGANKVAAVVFAAGITGYLITAHHVPDVNVEIVRFVRACGDALIPAAIFWLAYVALEPWVRRHLPASLVSWTRLLTRGVRDPLVGRDVLIGLAFGLLLTCFSSMWMRLLEAMGRPPLAPQAFQVFYLRSGLAVVDVLLERIIAALITTMFLLLIYVGLRKLFRVRALAAVGLGLFFMIVLGAEDFVRREGGFGILGSMVFTALVIFPLLRFGLLPFAVGTFASQSLILSPLTTSFGAWHGFPTLIVGGLLLAMTVYAFVQARAGAPLFGQRLLEE